MSKIAFGQADQAATTTFAKLRVESKQQDTTKSLGGDTISLSKEAQDLASDAVRLSMGKDKGDQFASATEKDEGMTVKEAMIKMLKERIEKLKQEIKDIEQSALPDDEKAKQLQDKQSELNQLNSQLQKLQGTDKSGPVGGTRAGESSITGRKSLT